MVLSQPRHVKSAIGPISHVELGNLFLADKLEQIAKLNVAKLFLSPNRDYCI